MTHLDDERLAGLALAEPATAAEREHLDACDGCRARLDRLADVRHLAVAAPSRAEGAPVALDAAVWDRIAAQAGLRGPEAGPEDEPEVEPGAARGQAPRHAKAARGSRRWLAVAAAAALVAGAGGLAAGLAIGGEDEPAPDQEIVVVARTSLAAPGEPSGVSGAARVVQEGGRTLLNLSLEGAEDAAGPGEYLEVWLIHEDLSRMVSVGVVGDGWAQPYAVPKRLLDEGYLIVDVSREGLDADPAHSGDSLARGLLS